MKSWAWRSRVLRAVVSRGAPAPEGTSASVEASRGVRMGVRGVIGAEGEG